MFDCLILGDSIAKGVSDVRRDCVAYVQSGINSPNYLTKFGTRLNDAAAKSVLISLGSNDSDNITEASIRKLREKFVDGQVVYWVLPNIKERVRKTVWMVAKEYDDIILDARNYDRSSDTVHPTYKGYKQLGKDFK